MSQDPRPTPHADGGWTLIELLIVLSLILILTSMALTQYSNSITRSKEAALASDLYLMRDAIDQYFADKGKYPDSLQSLVSEHYIRQVPVDPFTRSSDTWVTEQAETSASASSADAGIYNVKSGSDGTSLDGRRYSDFN